MAYAQAIGAYEAALEKKIGPKEAEYARVKLAESYQKVKDYQNAERVYRSLFASSTNLEAKLYLKYAQILASNGKYLESQEIYAQYNVLADQDPRGKAFSTLYNDISVLSRNAKCYNVNYLNLNTSASEFSPAYYRNGLVFVSNRSNAVGLKRVFSWNQTPFLDLFYLQDTGTLGDAQASLGGSSGSNDRSNRKKKGSRLGDDEYTAPTANDSRTIGTYGGTNINAGLGYADEPKTESQRFSGTINTKYHEGPSAFFKDGQKVIFTRNNFLNGRKGSDSQGINRLKLYEATAGQDGWGNIKELPFNNDEYSTGHPSLSPNEDLLFFVSDMPGGFGGTDLYVSKWENDTWSSPLNLGPNVNTAGNEMFPFIDENGNLYFSSEGWPGAGGLDIFYVTMDGEKPKGKPDNLGIPINSNKDDFGLITDGLREKGYFSSNRKRGGDDDDIYSFERHCALEMGCDLILAVYDEEVKMPLDNVTITYGDESGALKEVLTDEKGNVLIEDLAEGHEYTFQASREGYSTNTVSFITEDCGNEPSKIEIPLSVPKALAEGLNDPNGLNGNEYNSDLQCILTGHIFVQNTTQALENVKVTLQSLCDSTVQTAYTDATGLYQLLVQEGCDYTISASKGLYAAQTKLLNKVKCTEDGISENIYMFSSGDVVKIENIYFNYGKYSIRPDAQEGLDRLVNVLREYPEMKISLASHTDSRSSKDFNQKLSENRAKATAEYLYKRGVNRSRILSVKGYGESMILNGCVDGVKCSEAQHQANRRTEFKIEQMQ